MRKIIFCLAILALIVPSLVLVFGKEMGEKDMGKKMDIVETMPEARFLFPSTKTKLKTQITIRLKVEGASAVEFYGRRPESLVPIYVGAGSLSEGENWIFEWDTTSFPNGTYNLYAQITNQYGQYLSGEIEIEISNETAREVAKEEKLKQEIEALEKGIEKKEEAIKEKEEESKEKVKMEAVEKKEEVGAKVEAIVEKTKEEKKIEKEIEKQEKEKKQTEEKIKEVEKELKELPEKPLPELKQDKEERLQAHQEQKAELERKIESSQKGLEEVKKVKQELKSEVIEKVKTEKQGEVKRTIEELETSVSKEEKAKIELVEKLAQDSDEDGIPDKEEIRLGTDPFNPDSDGDGFLDGVEMVEGFNPKDPSPADKIVYQDPRKVKPQKADIYKVERIEKTTLPTGQAGLKLEGKGLPNSFVTIYVFSLPTVLVTKTDGNGYWEYILDKPLADGQHTVYATVTNNHGAIEARSESFVFVVSGEKLFRIFQAPEAQVVSPAQVLQRSFAILVAAVIVFGIGVALTLIGLSIRRKQA